MDAQFKDSALIATTLQLSGIIEESISNGPGLRLVVFAQGCKHHCEGCHNPQSHDFNGGTAHTVQEILSLIDENPLLDGVTFSGGDPVEQPIAFALLAQHIKARGLHVTTYTGYTFETLLVKQQTNPALSQLLAHTDLLIDGPFMLNHKNGLLKFRGSDNQRMIDMNQSLLQEMPIEATV